MSARNITWYSAGEIIAWNNYPTLETSVAAANIQWLNSPGHKAIVVSTTYNYVGVGLAIDSANGKKIWTAVYMKGPDRTGARAKTAAPTSAPERRRQPEARHRQLVRRRMSPSRS